MAHDDKGQPTWRRPIGEKCVAHDDKGQPTWRRPIGEKVRRSVWHKKTKVSPLLHRGGL